MGIGVTYGFVKATWVLYSTPSRLTELIRTASRVASGFGTVILSDRQSLAFPNISIRTERDYYRTENSRLGLWKLRRFLLGWMQGNGCHLQTEKRVIDTWIVDFYGGYTSGLIYGLVLKNISMSIYSRSKLGVSKWVMDRPISRVSLGLCQRLSDQSTIRVL